ncbi:hypothetical protein OURE66S_01856 [Oligella ureolytica]
MSVNQANIIESLEKVCTELNQDDFIYEFMDAFGFPKSTITRLRNKSDGRNVGEGDDVGVKKKLYFKVVTENGDISEVGENLKNSSLVEQHDIRFVIVTDFKEFVAYDLVADEALSIYFDELPKQYGFFLPLAGYEKAIMFSEHPADLKASEKMGQLFDHIKESNDLTKEEDIHALNVFLTRVLFCFFAEDTGIFTQSQFTNAIQSYTKNDGSDVDAFLTDLFTILNLEDKSAKRKEFPVHLQAFPYVNGGLFRDDEPVPEFGQKARRIFLECGSLNWSEINPDIFGSMFQAVIDEEQRGNLGQHYTSVSNIMKVIQPLFLDSLYIELDAARGNKKKLEELLLRLSRIRVFDPACGSGNFLIIAYKELRKFEMEVFKGLNALTENSNRQFTFMSQIQISQFYGVEIDDFATEIALLSLWLVEHQMNLQFHEEFGVAIPFLPLQDSGHVVCGNSLRLDWDVVCPKVDKHGEPYEVYVCGNPPFLGATYRSDSQNQDMSFVFKDFKKYGYLDYVASFFWKGSQYIKESGALAFVATNSICQGVQVSMLWPAVFELGVEIKFAYQTFAWNNSAKGKAAVHVIIVGLSAHPKEKAIYQTINGEIQRLVVKNISPYLIEGSSLAVKSRSKPFGNIAPMIYGNKVVDGGHLLLSRLEKEELVRKEPLAESWIKKLLGSDEFLNGRERYCLWLADATEAEISAMPLVKEKVERVRKVRLNSRDPGAQKLAKKGRINLEI